MARAKKEDGGCAIILVVGFVALLLGKCAGPERTPDDASESLMATSTKYVASARGANCRNAPALSGERVATLEVGEMVGVGEERDGWSVIARPGTDCWIASRLLSDTAPIASAAPAPLYDPPARRTYRERSDPAYSCGVKWKCGQMDSCAEANHYLNECGVSRLDGDGDGVPCDSICG